MMSVHAFAAAVVIGLVGSVHCVAMCGGIVGLLCAGLEPGIKRRPLTQLPMLLAYNVGRIASYVGAGIGAGAIGRAAGHALPGDVGSIALELVSAAVMVTVGLKLAGITRGFDALERIGAAVWMHVQPVARRLLPVRTPAHAVALGLLWGWMPCGLVYSALALAFASGSAIRGGVVMAAFGLGTLPMLLGLGLIAGGVARASRNPSVQRGVGLAFFGFGVIAFCSLLWPGEHARVLGSIAVGHCH